MKHRSRVLAALMALFSFSAAVAGQGSGAVCTGPGAEHAAPAHACHAMAGHAADQPEHGGAPERPAPASCPMQLSSATCAAPVVAPAPVSGWEPPRLEAAAVVVLSDRIPDLLVGTSLFRPPQA